MIIKFINTTIYIALYLEKEVKFTCGLEHHQRAAACGLLCGGGRRVP